MPKTFYPSSVQQVSDYPDQEIGWVPQNTTHLNYLLNARWKTVRDLAHLSNPATGDLRNKTYALYCTGFNIPPIEINGIELTVSAQRNGRIVDDTIQLTYQNDPIGVNNFTYDTDSEGHLLLLNQTTYGSPTDLWGATVNSEIVQDPSFGVILKFQSHPFYPHRCGMFLDSVAITIY